MLEDECALQLTLHRRRSGSCQGIQETPELAKGGAGPHRSIRQGARQLVISLQMFSRLLPSKRKLKITFLLHTNTHTKEFLLRREREKKKPGNIFEGKGCLLLPKCCFFPPCLWQLCKSWRLQQRRNPFTCHHIKPLCSTKEMAKFHP